MLTIATAYATPNTPSYKSSKFLNGFASALAYSQHTYGSCDTKACPGNWFFWDITVPLNLGPALMLLQADLPAASLTAPLKSMKVHIGTVASLSSVDGQNRVYYVLGHVYAGVVGNDTSELTALGQLLASTCAINDRPFYDGPKSDGSYQFHGGILYSGGYGADWILDILMFANWGAGTRLAIPAACQTLAMQTAQGAAWMEYRTTWDVSSFARYVTRAGVSGGGELRDIYLEAVSQASPLQMSLAPEAKSLVQLIGSAGTFDGGPMSAALLASSVKAAQPTGHKTFNLSDLVVHRDPNYYVSFKLYSSRSLPGESINGEDTQGSRAADGRMYLAVTGTELWANGVVSALDWDRLPGITVEYSKGIGNATFGCATCGQSFVGGADDGVNGVSAMVSHPSGQTLTLKKSWFTFNDVIVVMVNSIASKSSNPTETIINQWPIQKASSVQLNGKAIASPYSAELTTASYAQADGVQYFIPGGQDAQVMIDTRQSIPLLTLYLNHGAAVPNGNALYVLGLPGAPSIDWRSGSVGYTMLQNDANVSALSMGSSTGVVFWAAGQSVTLPSKLRITATAACVLYITQLSGGQWALSVADPNHTTSALSLQLSQPLKLVSSSTGVTVSATASSTQVVIPALNGASGHVTLGP